MSDFGRIDRIELDRYITKDQPDIDEDEIEIESEFDFTDTSGHQEEIDHEDAEYDEMAVGDCPECPYCNGSGMEDDISSCPECDGEGVKWWLC